MLTDRATIQHLIRTTRRKYVERGLCCPVCGDTIKLKFGRLWCCSATCAWVGDELRELAVRT